MDALPFEIFVTASIRGLLKGFVMGMAMLALMSAVGVLFHRRERRGRSIEPAYRTTAAASSRRIRGPAVRIAHPRGVYGLGSYSPILSMTWRERPRTWRKTGTC